MLESRTDLRNRMTLLTYMWWIIALVAIVALVLAAIGFHATQTANQLEIVTGLFQDLPTALSPSQTDTTLVVIGCTNMSISGTNDVIDDGKVMFANNCPVIEDNLCQEHVCTDNGICARRTITGGECSEDEQCVDTFGPGYICNITLCECQVMVPVNGSMYTNSLVCDNNGTMSVVMVMDAQCPTPGQVLTAIDSFSADWQDITMASASELECEEGTIVVSNATCPSPGQVLTATSSGTAEWDDPNLEIPCVNGTVIVSNSSCPTNGDVLTATGPGTAEWSAPTTIVTTETVLGFDPNDQLTPMSIGVDVTFVNGGVHGGGAARLSLASGFAGQSHIVTLTVLGTSGAELVSGTGITLAGVTSVTFNSVGDSVHLLWNGSAWAIIGNYGVVIV